MQPSRRPLPTSCLRTRPDAQPMKKESPVSAQGSERYAPWERKFERVISPFEEFIRRESTSGLLLMACAVLALALANSALAAGYHHFFDMRLGLGLGPWRLEMSLHHWINDGLMALFFFVVGLEIKREILVGELARPRQAALPIVAAIGGMVVPALIYVAITRDSSAVLGWGIPMATDIAFAVGVLVLLGSRIPRSLITFLVALAIVDDLGGVAVIALFYTDEIVRSALVAAGILLCLLVLFNRIGVRSPLPYFLAGLGMWLAMLQSGIHATLAGIFTALTIPAWPKYDPARFSQHVKRLMLRFDASLQRHETLLQSDEQSDEQSAIVQTLENGIRMVETPLRRLERSMHMPVAFIVIPLFALANAGIPVPIASLTEVLTHPVTAGVVVALVAGKFIGIAGISWLALKAGIGALPAGVDFRHIAGVGLLGGIGFTMSIFIAELGFKTSPDHLLMAKTGILLASVISGLCGSIWLLATTRRQ